MDFTAIKAQFNLATEVERDLGAALKHSGQWDFWRCPFHADGDPSFGVNDERYHCFGCEADGDIIDWLKNFRGLSLEAIAAQAGQDTTETRLRRLEYQQRDQARRIADHERRLTALEKIHACRDHITYHAQMPEAARQYWYDAGMLPGTITQYQLGFCPRCPTDTDGRASYTIPVKSNGQLWNIRHRLVAAPNGDKYRPHMAGLPSVLFNADYLRSDIRDILVVEGEKKSIIAAQEGLPNVGVMGKAGFQAEWVGLFSKFQTVYICYDPDGLDKAAQVAALFGGRGRVVSLPGKLDDLIVDYNASYDDLLSFIRLAKKP